MSAGALLHGMKTTTTEERNMPRRTYTVRLAINRPDYSANSLHRNITAQDADHAAALAVTAAERETGQTGWLLDGPVEES